MRSLPWKTLAVGGALLLLGGLATFAWLRQPTRTQVYTDADTIRAARDTVEPRDVLWQPPTALAAEINTTAEDYEPQLSWDGLTLYFVRGKAGQNADLFVARRTPQGWTAPVALDALNSEYDELGPEPSRDGTALYFYSDRPGGAGGYDIWVARRSQDGWDPPENLGAAVNSPYNDYGPAVTPGDDLLYFASNRPLPEDTRVPDPDAWPATAREQFLQRTYDLYAAPRSARGFGAAQPVVETLTPHNEATPAVSPTGDFLYFASDRPGGLGGFDLYRARRMQGTLREPVGLRSPVNTPANELDPGLTQLGYGLYFSSDRLLLPPEQPGAQPPVDAAETVASGAERPDYNLYYSASREVFLETERTPPPPIDWAALLPWLLWLLLALLLLATLLALWGALREKRLGLLARCLLASLLAHLLLLLLFSFLRVTEQVMSGLNPKPEIRISLASPSQTSILAAQVRPDHAERPTQPAEAIELQPTEIVVTPPEPPEMIRTEAPRATPEIAEVAAEAPREAQPVARRPETPTPALPGASEPLTMPVPDEVVAESAPETSTEAIAATLERPRLEASPPRFATSQPVRAPFELEPGRTLAAAMQLPATERGLSEARQTRSPETPAPRSLPAAASLALDLPEESAAVTVAEDAPAPTPAAATGLLTPASIEMPAAQLQRAVLVEPVDDTRQAFALASSVTPTAREARPSIPRSTAAPRRRPSAPPELPLALLDEVPQPTPEAAAPSPAGYAARPVELAPADVVAAPLQRRFEPASPLPVARGPEDLTLPGGTPRAALREASATTRLPRPTPTAAPAALPLAMDLALPTETEAPARPSALAHRTTPQRRELLEELGGDAETEAAVRRSLAWLARHQSDHGGWDGLLFDRGCGECEGTSEYAIDAAVTGLSLLCFLGAGHTHTEDGPYRDNVARGIAWLLNLQDDRGSLSPNETLYSHGIATIALAEAYALTGDRALYRPLQSAVRHIDDASNPRTGGWRYQPGEEADTSVTGWQVMALASARTAGLAVPQKALQSAEAWLDRAERRPGLYVYQPGGPISVTMTAEAMFMRQLLGRDRGARDMRTSARLIASESPDWDEVDTYRWYYTTLALFHHQGPAWSRWNEALKRELLASQRQGGKADGSWDPVGPWADVGGRIYQTALCTLMLEIYYRYLPMYAEPAPVARAPGDPVGRVYGRVYDSESGAPLAAARVRLDRPDGDPLEIETDERGEYSLDIPQMPEHFAIAASRSGYLPRALGAEAAALADGRLQLNFALEPIGSAVLALEDPPRVHHLGNDRWEGRINSQFQRSAEGQRLTLQFELPSGWESSDIDQVVLSFLAKGVQCPHRVRINGRPLAERLGESPEDGSYGDVRLTFPAGLLTAGTNTFELRASSCAGDVDDFEFLNVQLRFEE